MKRDAFEHPKGKQDTMALMRLRGGLGIGGAALTIAALTFIACSDDESSGATSADGGPDGVGPNPTATTTTTAPPPIFPDAPAPPPDLQSRSGFMGNATEIGDVGASADGPSWRTADGALYFTVPSSPTPLRRLVPGGTPSIVTVDASTFAPVGTASGGGNQLFLTESEAVVTLDLDDAGAVTAIARKSGLGGTVFGDIATTTPGPAAWFVDTQTPRIYRFVAPSDMSLMYELGDAGRTTALATRSVAGDNYVYVGVGGTSIAIMRDIGGTLQLQDSVETNGIPPNGIAIDEGGRIFVAWAKGIDIFTASGSGTTTRPQDGDAMLPINAIPTSLTFGGADRKTLFVTTSKGKIYSVPVQTAGILR